MRANLRALFDLGFPASLLAQGLRWIAIDDVFGLSPNYTIISKILPEVWWGILFVLSALIFGAGICLFRHKYRILSLLGCGGMWFFVGVSILFSNIQSSFAVPMIFMGIFIVIRTLETPCGCA